MVNTPTREEHLTTWLAHAKGQYTKANEELRQVQAKVNHWGKYAEHLEELLRLETEGRDASGQNIALDRSTWRDKSIREVLIDIAKDNHNRLITREAIRPLVEAGLFPTAKAARDNIYSTVRRSKDFQWESEGVYALVLRDVTQKQSDAHRSATQRLSLSQVIEPILANKPALTLKELVKAVKETSFNFGRKHPSLAVNMALIQLRKKMHKARQETTEELGALAQPAPQQPTLVPQQTSQSKSTMFGSETPQAPT